MANPPLIPFWHKSIRLDRLKYIGLHSHFVTLCCDHRRPAFANARNAAWLVEMLREKSIAFCFAVHAYCVMPDHLHALVHGLKKTSDLLAFVKNLKQTTGHEYLEEWHKILWQKKFYDYILRERDRREGVAAYI